jgi:hypothetical protein
MSTNVVHLDDATFARAKHLADARSVSVEHVISQAIERLSASAGEPGSGTDILGAFADCADDLDEIVEEAYQARERDPLRLKSE